MTLLTVWLAIAIVAAIAEALFPLFGYFFVTAAALVAALAAHFNLSIVVQALSFAVALLACMLILRPRFLAKLGARGVPSRTESLIGKTGTVTQAIDPASGTGRILVAGEDWAAQSATTLPIGSSVRVHGADGNILHVSPPESGSSSPRSLA